MPAGELRGRNSGQYRCYPYLALTVFAISTADLGVLAVMTWAPGVIGVVAWLGVAGVFAFGWLARVPITLRVSRTELSFEAPAASGSVPLSQVRSVRPVAGLPGAAVVRLVGRLPLLVVLRPGWAPLAARLARHPCATAYDS